MKQTRDIAAATHARPARRRTVGKGKAKPSTVKVNQEGEWMGSDELRLSLLAQLSTQPKVTLDLAGLTHVDAAAFQVLVSAAQTEAFADGKLQLVNVSEHVRQYLQYAGADLLLAGLEEAR